MIQSLETDVRFGNSSTFKIAFCVVLLIDFLLPLALLPGKTWTIPAGGLGDESELLSEVDVG